MRYRTYVEAKAYYLRLRLAAYAYSTERMSERLALPNLALAQIDARALATWREHWTEPHPSGIGPWDWEQLIRSFRRDPSAFTLALWYGDLLCGMAVGRASERRATGDRAA